MTTNQNPIKKTVRVTIEKEIEIELTPAMFGPMTEAEFVAEWQKILWPIDGIDDVVKHAAVMAATNGSGYMFDGLGLLGNHDMTYPRVPDVKFLEIYEDIETEIQP